MKLKITLFIFALISFFVDAATLYLLCSRTTNLLLCVYVYSLVYTPIWQLLSSIGFLLCIQDFLMFGHAGIQLIYLLPLTAASYALSYSMYPNSIQLLCTATLAGLMQTVIIESFLLERSISTCYTAQVMCGNIIGVVLISLILKIVRLSGLLGNRIRVQ